MSERPRAAGMGILVVSHLLPRAPGSPASTSCATECARSCDAHRHLRPEGLRAPFVLALLVPVPVALVVSAAGTLSDFAGPLGGPPSFPSPSRSSCVAR
jgi:hypothetical protein